MKFLFLLISVLMFQCGISLNAQESLLDIQGEFIYLRDGTLLKSNEFTTTVKSLERKFNTINGEEIPRHTIRFVRFKHSIHGVIGKNLVKAHKVGKVTLFRVFDSNPNGPSSTTFYFAKGLEYIKKLDAGALYSDLIVNHSYDNIEDKEYLEKLIDKGENRKIQKILVGGSGLAGMGIGAIVIVSFDNPGIGRILGGLIWIGGFVTTIYSLFMRKNAPYLKAVKYFNSL